MSDRHERRSPEAPSDDESSRRRGAIASLPTPNRAAASVIVSDNSPSYGIQF